MALIDHEGEALISDGGLAFYHPDEDVVLPSVILIGTVRVNEAGHYLQDVNLGTPDAGWWWVVGLEGGPFRHPEPGVQTIDMGTDGFTRPPLLCFLDSIVSPSPAIPFHLVWPGSAVIKPGLSLTPTLDREALVGASLSIACANAFTGSPLSFRAALTSGAALPESWSFNTTTGVLEPSTAEAFAAQSVTVVAFNALGEQSDTFTITVSTASVTPLSNTSPGVFTPDVQPGTAVGSVWRARSTTWAGGTPPFTDVWAAVNDAAVGAFNAPSSRTVVSADAGHSFGIRARRTDSSIPPVSVTVTPVGTATIPAIPPSDYIVDDEFELRAAMVAAATPTGARLILIRGNEYGPMPALANCQKAGQPLTIRTIVRSDAPGVKPTFLTTNSNVGAILQLDRMKNIIWDGIIAENRAKDGLGFPHANPQFIISEHPQDVTWRNFRLKGWHRGGTIRESTNLRYEYGHFTRCGMDDMRHFNRNDGLTWWHCLSDESDVDESREFDASGHRHSDGAVIQIAFQPLPVANGRYGSRDVLVQGCTFKAPTGQKQLIFFANAQGNSLADFNNPLIRHERFTARLNCFESGAGNCIFARNVKDLLVEDNVIHKIVGGQQTPQITLAGFGSGIIRRNVTPGIKAGNPTGSNLNQFTRVDNNIIGANDRTTWSATLPAPLPCGPYAYERGAP